MCPSDARRRRRNKNLNSFLETFYYFYERSRNIQFFQPSSSSFFFFFFYIDDEMKRSATWHGMARQQQFLYIIFHLENNLFGEIDVGCGRTAPLRQQKRVYLSPRDLAHALSTHFFFVAFVRRRRRRFTNEWRRDRAVATSHPNWVQYFGSFYADIRLDVFVSIFQWKVNASSTSHPYISSDCIQK